MLGVAREWVLGPMVRHGAVAAWIVDDTGFPKQGQHSVGVARQYCGVLGKQDNCQVAVSVSVANEAVSVPVAYQLYLPEAWASDRRRRRAAGVPDALPFQPKWQIALGQIHAVQAEAVPRAPVVADAGYGDTTAFRDALTAAGLPYVVGVKKETTAWPPGEAPWPPKRWTGRGRPSTRVQRTATHTPRSLKHLAGAVPPTAWRTVTWREGTRGAMRSRFARLRVRPAHRDEQRATPRPEEWVLIEWPRGDAEPTKYWLSTLPATTSLADLVRLAKLRWRVERDYQELKEELGSIISRAAAGAASITWRVMYRGLWLPRRRAREAFPPERLWPSSAPLVFPKVSSRGALPVRPERHVPTSIATMYELLARALLHHLPCRACGRAPEPG